MKLVSGALVPLVAARQWLWIVNSDETIGDAKSLTKSRTFLALTEQKQREVNET